MQTHTFISQFTTKFEYIQAKTSETNKNSPDLSVVYIHGLNSDPWGRKPEEVKAFCLKHNLSFSDSNWPDTVPIPPILKK